MWFVDWLNIHQQFDPSLPDFFGGRVISIEGAGSLQSFNFNEATGEELKTWLMSGDEANYSVQKFSQHKGSFETNVFIRMTAGKLEIRGNPSSYGRLDNVFGYSLDDSIQIYNNILYSLGLPLLTSGVVEKTWNQFEQKFYEKYTGAIITRVDYAVNYSVGLGNVKNFHKWISKQKLYRSAPTSKDLKKFVEWDYSTVYSSVSSTYINVKNYDKAEEIEEQKLPEYLKKIKKLLNSNKITNSEYLYLSENASDYLLKLACYLAENGISRHEQSYKSRFMNQNREYSYWYPNLVSNLFLEKCNEESVKMTSRAVVYQCVNYYEVLTAAELKVFTVWKSGVDLLNDSDFSKSALYRHRSSILSKIGHDVLMPVYDVSSVYDTRPVYFQMKTLSVSDLPNFYVYPSVSVAA